MGENNKTRKRIKCIRNIVMIQIKIDQKEDKRNVEKGKYVFERNYIKKKLKQAQKRN